MQVGKKWKTHKIKDSWQLCSISKMQCIAEGSDEDHRGKCWVVLYFMCRRQVKTFFFPVCLNYLLRQYIIMCTTYNQVLWFPVARGLRVYIFEYIYQHNEAVRAIVSWWDLFFKQLTIIGLPWILMPAAGMSCLRSGTISQQRWMHFALREIFFPVFLATILHCSSTINEQCWDLK